MIVTTKLKNKAPTWSILSRPRINDVAYFGGDYYSNISGMNSVVTDATNWFKITNNSAALAAPRLIIPDSDPRLLNAAGVWTLTWDSALATQFGTDEATIKVLFDDGTGKFIEQKSIQPGYNYTAGDVTSVTLEILVTVTFKLIITV